MNQKIIETRSQTLAKKMSELKIGKDDVRDINDVDYKVEERLI
jgi:hypothetical protein